MYVCICNGITDRQIQKVIDEDGANTLEMVTQMTSAGNCCGACSEDIKDMIDLSLDKTINLPILSASIIRGKIQSSVEIVSIKGPIIAIGASA